MECWLSAVTRASRDVEGERFFYKDAREFLVGDMVGWLVG
jgi:hypothetical protein